MSYILDALRRADAERERGGVPGLHTQAMPELGDDERAPRARGLRPWHWVALGLTGGLAVALAWQWSGSSDTVAPPPPSQPPPPVALAAAPPPAAMPATALPAPSLPPPAAAPAVAPAVAPAIAPAIAPMRATPPPANAAASAPAAPEPQRIASLAALPAELRAGLPALSFGGSIYSNTPANRLLIVNGQLLHEGDALGPGTTLEQIKPKAAVINIRGQRFEIAL